MKNLKLLIVISGMIVSLASCAPNHEEIKPNDEETVSVEFDTKSEESGSEGKPGRPNPD